MNTNLIPNQNSSSAHAAKRARADAEVTGIRCHSCSEPFPCVQLGGKEEKTLFRVFLLADSEGDSQKTFFCNEFCYNWYKNHRFDDIDGVTGLTTTQLGHLFGSEGHINWDTKDLDDIKTQTTLSTLSTDSAMDDAAEGEPPFIPPVPTPFSGTASLLRRPTLTRQTATR